jgi:hypothetical protein
VSELGDAARSYAEAGLCHVFPLWPGKKTPIDNETLLGLKRPGESLPQGVQEAGGEGGGELLGTRVLSVVEDWWRRFPDANIGAALRFGALFVLDVDARNGGHHTLEALSGCDVPDTLCSVSGSGWPSRHLWFMRDPRMADLVCTSIGPGLDIKGCPRGYVVVPPSLHPCGEHYEWHDYADPLTTEIATCPQWLLTAILGNSTRFSVRGSVVDVADPLSFPRGRDYVATGGSIGKKLANGKWLAVCPNSAQHTGGRRRNDSSCVLMAPSRPGGRGRLFCSHSHCLHVR